MSLSTQGVRGSAALGAAGSAGRCAAGGKRPSSTAGRGAAGAARVAAPSVPRVEPPSAAGKAGSPCSPRTAPLRPSAGAGYANQTFWNSIRPGPSEFQNVWFAYRSEEHTSELQSRPHLVCRLLLEKKKELQTTSC